MRDMKKIFSNSLFQRILYLSTFILLTIVLFDRLLHYTWSYSSLGVSYFFLWLTPSLLCIFQLVFNTKVGWFLFFLLYVSISVYTFVSFLVEMIGAIYVKYYIKDFVIYILSFIVIFVLGGTLIYLIRPFDNIKAKRHKKI